MDKTLRLFAGPKKEKTFSLPARLIYHIDVIKLKHKDCFWSAIQSIGTWRPHQGWPKGLGLSKAQETKSKESNLM
jgi:hypothetical protein